MREDESAAGPVRTSEVWYLLAAVLSVVGVLLAAVGYFPAWGTLVLMASAFCLALGLVLASQVSEGQRRAKRL